MNITEQQLSQILPHNKNLAELCQVLNKILNRYGINTTNRVAGFLAQCAATTAAKYQHNAEKIANRVYASRMGNGPEISGDGYRFRGRGAIQLTGHDNYALFAKSIGMTSNDITGYLATTQGAIEAACWFWKSRNINAACDADDINKMTRLTNGGTNDLDQRHEKYETAKRILEGVTLC
jgi:putative chitinase